VRSKERRYSVVATDGMMHQRYVSPHWLLAVSIVTAISLLLCPLSYAEYVHKYPFLYATTDDVNASFPVIEHLSREYRGDYQNDFEKSVEDSSIIDEDDQPDFLYQHDQQGYRIVEYYVHWCSTCKIFASVYHNFAVKIRQLAAQQGIQDNIHIYAVSCSPNRKLCVNQNVKGFPKIRLYKPGESDYVELSHHTHLHPLRVLETLGINFDGTDDIESDKDDWDVESAMMTLSHSETASNRLLTPPPSYWGRFVSYFVGVSLPTETSMAPTLDRWGKYRRTREDLKADIYLSFDYALRNEIYRSTDGLSSEQQQVLRDWLELLIRTLPSSWEIHKLLQELIDNFVYIVKSEDYLMSLLDEYPAPTQSWSVSCSFGIADEGYTCGLWEMFHTVTVGVVEYNKATFDPSQLLVTETSARTLRDYIDHFFGCTTCRDNFLSIFDACGFNRCDRLSDYPIEDENDWIELPLWLYEMHNHVNVRLMKEKATRDRNDVTDADIVNVQWPSRQECSTCWKNNTEQDESLTTWRSDMIYKFLRLEYGSRDAYTSDLRRELNPEPIEEQQQKHVLTDTVLMPATNHLFSSFTSPKKPIIRMKTDSTVLIPLSHASVVVVCIFLLSVAATRKRKIKVA
jgi:Erv1 / Alr family/Thioredoxin